MVKTKIQNEKTAQIEKHINLKSILRLVSIFGKPPYYILLATIFFLYITGYFTRTVITNLTNYLKSFTLTCCTDLPKKIVFIIVELLKKISHILLLGVKSVIWIIKALYTSGRFLISKLISFLKNSRDKIKFLILKAKLSLLFLKTKLTPPKAKGKKRKKKKYLTLKIFTFGLIGASIIGLTGSYIFWFYIIRDLPSPSDLTIKPQVVSTKIYDRNGILLYKIYKDENRSPVTLSQLPKSVTLSTLAIEDAEFYSHPGFSVRGILRAIVKNIKKGELTGGSTITQQLVKNTLLSSEKTLVRKIKEIILAVKVELNFSKDQILEMYLNEVSYGGTAYGIQEASRAYFDKNASDLDLAEASLLAGIPKSPSRYSPFGSNPQNAFDRQKEVLHLMKVNGFISDEERQKAESEKIVFASPAIEIKAPHFVMYLRNILDEKYGKEVVENGGLEVTTSLDMNIQKLAEDVVNSEIDKLKNLNVTNAGVIVLNPQNGEILAMIGSKDYFDTQADGNVNVTTALRQPGSSIKVINYAYALSDKYTPASILDDSPVTFLIPNQEPYTPKNYEGGYRGKITLRNALAESRNIPAVKVLNSYGVSKMIEMGNKMGITTWNEPKNYGLSLTLGGGDVKLIDLAAVYATIANYGKKSEIKPVLSIKNYQGKILEDNNCQENERIFTEIAQASFSARGNIEAKINQCKSEEVLSPQVAFLITDILKDNNARAPSFGRNSQLVIKGHPEVAVKTGTSNNLRDNLTIGYNQNYLVAVWVGNNNNSPMNRIASGVTGASPIFNKIMSALLVNEKSNNWIVPKELVQLPICPYTGTLACEGCPVKMEWFLEKNKPTTACNFQQIEAIMSTTPMPQILDEAASIERITE